MTKSLIFLGSNSNIVLFAETAEHMGITVHGILDNDYFGNTESVCNIPIIGSEDSFNFNSEEYIYFVGPSVVPINVRDRQKRIKMIELIERLNLPLATLINRQCEIGKTAKIHSGAYIGYGVCIGHSCEVMPHTQLHTYAMMGHHSKLGKNSVIERAAFIASHTNVGENVHIGFNASLFQNGSLTVGDNSVVHPCVTVMRDVDVNEVVMIGGDNNRRIYGRVVKI
jgi:serine acetyltransferase